jgi:hypothetical protein
MLKRFTSALMAAFLLGTLLTGAATARDARKCRMRGMHDCCRAMLHNSRAPELGVARLCCIVQRPQPTPARTNFTFRFSPDAAQMPRPDATQATPPAAVTHARVYSPPFQPSHSPPAYIQNLALLI